MSSWQIRYSLSEILQALEVVRNGAIVKAGERYGVPVPINRSLTAVLLNIVQGRVPWDEFRGRPERLLRAVGK